MVFVRMQHLVCVEGAECSEAVGEVQVAYMGVMWLWMVWGGAREGLSPSNIGIGIGVGISGPAQLHCTRRLWVPCGQ